MAKTETLNKKLLAAAISSSKPTEIREMVQDGADVNCTNKFGMTPLMLACQYNSCIAVAKALIESGADLYAKEPRYKSTPFHLAALSSSNPRIIETLLNAGADIECRNYIGETPLLMAINGNPNAKLAVALITNGADVNARDYQGNSALILAEKEKRKYLVKLLIEKGAN